MLQRQIFVLLQSRHPITILRSDRKGAPRLRLRTYGQPVNGSVINYVGESALHSMIRVLSGLNELSTLSGTVSDG